MKVVGVSVGVLIACLLGCGSDRPPFGVGARSPPTPSTTCPFGFRGTRVGVDDTAEGADITLIAYGSVEELRHRAREGLGRLAFAVRETEEDVADGARIHIAAVDPTERARVRAEIHARAEEARNHMCR